jgi:hypothetical protein
MAYTNTMQPTMSEQDLQRLADILKSRGEGLAAINPNEANLLQALGGAAQPLPGTQGMGPGGGPIRSYIEGPGQDAQIKQQSNNDNDNDNNNDNNNGNGGSIGPEPGGPESTTPETSEQEEASEQASIEGQAKAHNDTTIRFEGDPRVIQAYNRQKQSQSTGDGSGTTTTTTTTPPPKFYDILGNVHNSQADADAANKKYTDTGVTNLLATTPLTTDVDFDTWLAQNQDIEVVVAIVPEFKEDGTVTGRTREIKKKLSELDSDTVKSIFESKNLVSQDESKLQVKNFSDQVSGFLRSKGVDEEGNPIPMTQQDLENLTWEDIKDQFVDYTGGKADRLSEDTKREIFQKMLDNAIKVARFTLTPEERAVWKSPAPTVGTVSDATTVSIGQVTEATAPTADAVTVGDIADPGEVDIDEIIALDIEDIGAIDDLDDIKERLKKRISGEATSTAQIQLQLTTQNNVRQLLGLEAGATADPAKLRQIRQLYAETQQAAAGQSALLRAEETKQAEQALIEVAKTKGTMEMEAELANLETRRQVAIKEGDYESARQLQIAQASLTKVITQATIDRDLEIAGLDAETRTNIANLEARRILAIEQGKLDLAVTLGNLQKNIIIATTNAELALKSKALDDAMALAAFEGIQALEDIDLKVDLAQLEADLTTAGFDLQLQLKDMDIALQKYLAAETAKLKAMEIGTAEYGAQLKFIGTILTAAGMIAKSDISAKRNIRAADDQVEGFLDALNAYQYQYKDPQEPGADAGMFVGVMAQDLEKTPMGASFVTDTPQGKMVDYGHGLAAILASQSNLHDRLRQLEEG